jgi:hypothetical protein
MEGILSAAYHVCPSYNNFQFDTSFMYVIGVITTIKLYQSRHPDINPSSQKVFLFLALCILLNVIGVVRYFIEHNLSIFDFICVLLFFKFYGRLNSWFVISYSICHMVFFFGLSVVIYYMKQPKLEFSILKEMALKIRKEKGIVHIDRLLMLIIANAFNIGL